MHCQASRCDRCGRGAPLRSYETVICLPGDRPAFFAEPYRHRTDTSATGQRYEHLAMVWHADRVCRWICPCPCHAAPATPQQLDLFGTTA
jgi:hypothetical protein